MLLIEHKSLPDANVFSWGDLRAQVGKGHLQEEYTHTVHVKLVWVVQSPQDG